MSKTNKLATSPWLLPKSAEENVCVSLCESVANNVFYCVRVFRDFAVPINGRRLIQTKLFNYLRTSPFSQKKQKKAPRCFKWVKQN